MRAIKISVTILLFLIFSMSCGKNNYKTHEAMFYNNSSVTVYNVELNIKCTDNIINNRQLGSW